MYVRGDFKTEKYKLNPFNTQQWQFTMYFI